MPMRSRSQPTACRSAVGISVGPYSVVDPVAGPLRRDAGRLRRGRHRHAPQRGRCRGCPMRAAVRASRWLAGRMFWLRWNRFVGS